MGWVLLKRTHLQDINLLLSEVAPATTWQVLLGEACKVNAVELNDTVAEVLEDTTDDTVLA